MQSFFIKCFLFVIFFIANISAVQADSDIISSHNKNPIEGLYDLKISGEGIMRNNYDSDDRKRQRNVFLGRLRADLGVKLFGNFDLNSTFKFRDVQNSNSSVINNKSAADGKDSFFEDEGLFIDSITLDYNRDNLSLFAGKFTANFGQAWKLQNGIWNFEMARNNYRQNEKIGIGGSATIGDDTTGRYTFGASTFFNDRKYLDNSLMSKRDLYGKESGLPGDVPTLFQSYVGSVDIDFDFSKNDQEIPHEEKLSYHFSYLNLAINDKYTASKSGNIDDQKAVVANINYRYQLHQNLITDSLIEYVAIDNLDGDVSKSVKLITASLTFDLYRNLNLNFSHNYKKEQELGTNGIDSLANEVAIGYKFLENSALNNLQILVGYKYDKIDNKTGAISSNSVGALIRYNYNF